MQQSEKAIADDGAACEGRCRPCLSAERGAGHRGAQQCLHLLTCLQDDVLVETPRLILPDRHLRLHIHDIAEPIWATSRPARSIWRS